MIRSAISLAIALTTVACRHPEYLGVATLRSRAPACGAHAIAPRPSDRGPTYFACQVDFRAEPPSNRPLDYPGPLAQANVEGDVTLQFVLDQTGSVDSSTIKVLTSSHDLFVKAARQSILAWHARPAKRHGKTVRQLATHAFCFRVRQGAAESCDDIRKRDGATSVSMVCTPGTAVRCSSDGGCKQVPEGRPPNVPCA